jgi:hypothetical protein
VKKLFCPLLFLALFSCTEKPLSKSDYLQRALKSDTYKIALTNVKRVKDSLDSVKKRPADSNAVIYLYNTTVATSTGQVKTIAQVEKEMKRDTDILKSVQMKIAAEMAKHHQDSISKVKP